MAQKLKTFLLITFTAASLLWAIVPATANATVCAPDDPTCTPTAPTSSSNTTSTLGNGCVGKTKQQCLQDNPIVKDLNIVVGFLSGLVGVVVVGTIILGGIQYAAAGDKAEAVSAAKKRIINGLTALIAYLFIFAFLQWLIPGGIFK